MKIIRKYAEFVGYVFHCGKWFREWRCPDCGMGVPEAGGGGWIVASERMPEEHKCIDPETGYYGRSDDVLCSAYDEYEMRDEIWIDHTIDGERIGRYG